MKLQFTTALFALFFIFFSNSINAQEWHWHGQQENSTIKSIIEGTVKDMGEYLNCTNWNYGKKKLHIYDVYNYSFIGEKLKAKFKFSWHIDYVLGGSEEFSFTVVVSSNTNGFNTTIIYENETGSPDCRCKIGKDYDLGRVGD